MHCVIKNNNIHDNNEDGIYLKMNSSYNIISNNTVHHNYDMGKGDMVGDNLAIGISGSNDASNRTGNIIEYNSIYENGSYDEPQTGVYDNSISLYQVSNTDVRHNYIYQNKQGAFYAAYNSFNTSFYYNIVHRNHVQNGRLLFLGGNDNLSIYNNTVYENTLEATTTAPYNINSWRLISVEGPANNSTISNNIFAGNRMLTKTGYPAYLVRLGNSTTTVDYNIYYDNLSEDEVGNSLPLWHSTLNGTCPTLEMWNSLGYDLSSNKDNPRFINAVDSDFQIRPDSSAINAGIYIGIDSDIAGMSIEGSPDIGAHEYGAINTPYWEKNKYGSVSGSYVNTIYSDNAYEEITEATKNNGAFSQLQHKWQFDITGPQKATFYLRAHHTENSEGDHFIFSYKPSGTKVYIEMIEVKGTTPDDTYQTFQFPDNLTGTVTIQVKDTNRERSNRKLDTLYIEHMAIQSR